jgi:hypothetical protein
LLCNCRFPAYNLNNIWDLLQRVTNSNLPSIMPRIFIPVAMGLSHVFVYAITSLGFLDPYATGWASLNVILSRPSLQQTFLLCGIFMLAFLSTRHTRMSFVVAGGAHLRKTRRAMELMG